MAMTSTGESFGLTASIFAAMFATSSFAVLDVIGYDSLGHRFQLDCHFVRNTLSKRFIRGIAGICNPKNNLSAGFFL